MRPESELRSKLFTFLSQHQVMNLAYCDGQGPGVCAVWFAVQEDLTLVFLSDYASRHAAALVRGCTVAFTVQKDNQHWHSIQGVQGTGICQPVADEYRESAWAAYSRRFPFVIQQSDKLALALANAALWSVTPSWFRLIDNSRRFGEKEELILKDVHR